MLQSIVTLNISVIYTGVPIFTLITPLLALSGLSTPLSISGAKPSQQKHNSSVLATHNAALLCTES